MQLSIKKILYSWPFLTVAFFVIALPPWFIDTDALFPWIDPDVFVIGYIIACCMMLTLLVFKKAKHPTWQQIFQEIIFTVLLGTTVIWCLAVLAADPQASEIIFYTALISSLPFLCAVLGLVLRKIFPNRSVPLAAKTVSVRKSLLWLAVSLFGLFLVTDSWHNYRQSLDDVYYPFASPYLSQLLLGLFFMSFTDYAKLMGFLLKLPAFIQGGKNWMSAVKTKGLELRVVITPTNIPVIFTYLKMYYLSKCVMIDTLLICWYLLDRHMKPKVKGMDYEDGRLVLQLQVRNITKGHLMLAVTDALRFSEVEVSFSPKTKYTMTIAKKRYDNYDWKLVCAFIWDEWRYALAKLVKKLGIG